MAGQSTKKVQEAQCEDLFIEVPYYALHKKIGFFAAPLIACLMLLQTPPEGLGQTGWYVVTVATFMAIWWMTEAVSMTITALVPLIAFPLMGVMSIKKAAVPYASPMIFLFIGGFIIALAMQKWKLHLRIALNIIRFIGTKPSSMVGGLMVATAFMSMWISNTATLMMMLPLTLAVIHLLFKDRKSSKSTARNFATAALLGIAYAASIGGMGTVIGTPPNAFLKGFMENNYDMRIGFVDWMMVGVPVVILLTAASWVVLTKIAFPFKEIHIPEAEKIIDRELKKIGRMGKEEKLIAIISLTVALGWTLSGFLRGYIPGLTDATIAMIGAMAVFVTPTDFRRGQFLMTWEDAKDLPWGVLFLLGGGLSLASGFKEADFAAWIHGEVQIISHIPFFLLVLLIMTLILFLTEVMSNTATTNIFVPVVAAVAVGLGENPLLLVIPITIASSCAFMMPVATAPNAIVFGTGYIRLKDMMRAGILLNITGLIIIALVTYTVAVAVFDIVPAVVPEWALPKGV